METHTFNERKKRFEPKIRKCTFCKTGLNNNLMEDNCFYDLYNVKDRTNLVVFRNVKFNKVKIGIPRCSNCRKLHSRSKTATYIVLFLGIPLIFIIPVYFSVVFDLGTFIMIILLVATFGMVYGAMVATEKIILNSNDVKTEKDGAITDPLVRTFMASGWSIEPPRA